MGFSVEPKAEPSKVPGALNGTQASPSQQSARERAMAAFMGGQSPAAPSAPAAPAQQQSPVQDATHVSPEELGAIIPKFNPPTGQQDSQTSTTDDPATGEQAQPAEVTPQQPRPQPLSPKFAEIARQEKALRAKIADFNRQKAEFEAQRRTPAQPAQPQIDTSKYVSLEQLQKDPFGTLANHGLTYDQLTQAAVDAPSAEAVKMMQTIDNLNAKIAKLEQSQEKVSKSIEDGQKQSYEDAKRQLSVEASRLVKNDASYEMIKTTDSVPDVVELIERTFFEGLDEDHPKGTVLTVDEACQMVEEHLAEEATKLARLDKIQKRLKPAAPAVGTGQQATQQPTPQKQGMKTLTNNVGSSRQYSSRERAMLAAQYGPDWRSKVGA